MASRAQPPLPSETTACLDLLGLWLPVWFSAASLALSFVYSDSFHVMVAVAICACALAGAQLELLRRIEALEAGHAAPPAANRSTVSDANE